MTDATTETSNVVALPSGEAALRHRLAEAERARAAWQARAGELESQLDARRSEVRAAMTVISVAFVVCVLAILVVYAGNALHEERWERAAAALAIGVALLMPARRIAAGRWLW